MAIPSTSVAEDNASAAQMDGSTKVDDNAIVQLNRVRVVGGRNYDPKSGTSCHQCRQKTMNFSVSCKSVKKSGVCSINICHKCLLNRYGEKAEEVEIQGDWICPKCRGICNCSVCRKKKGHKPTGLLVHTAKAEGFNSVSELLSVKGPENFGIDRDVENMNASDKDPVGCSPRKRGKENSHDGIIDLNLEATPDPDEQDIKKPKRELLKEVSNGRKDGVAAVNNVVAKAKEKVKTVKERRKFIEGNMNTEDKEVVLDIPMPHGLPLTTVAGIEFDHEDVGNALQFLKFCETFGEVLDFKKSQAEIVLRELSRRGSGRSGRPEQYSSVIRFHTHFLSLLQEDIGEESPSTSNKNSWFQDLEKCISESGVSEHVLKGLPPGCFRRGGEGYETLNFSQKLRLVTFLCDEALCTAKLRNWIDEQVESKKEVKRKFAAAKDKEKHLKKKLQDERAEWNKRKNAENVDPVLISEQENIVAQIESETTQAEAELVEAMANLPQRKPEVLRIEPYRLDADGHVFWKLKGYTDEEAILLQDLGTRDAVLSEKWFVYGAEMKEQLEKYFSFLRLREARARIKKLHETPCESNEEDQQIIPEAN